MGFKPAKKVKAKLRLCLIGGPGTGKTKSALKIAESLCPGGKIAMIDTEHESGAKYGNKHTFDHMSLTSHGPDQFRDAITEAELAGYDVVIIDSLSHAWAGSGGALELVDQKTTQSGNKFQAWGKVTPMMQHLIEKIIGCKAHVIATLRSKVDHVQEKDERTGKTVIRKVGMQPVMRDGIEYEFDLVGDLDQDNTLHITKSRCEDLKDKVFPKPGPEVAKALLEWLNDGEEAVKSDSSAVPEAITAIVIPNKMIERHEALEKIVARAVERNLAELVVRNMWMRVLESFSASTLEALTDTDFDLCIIKFKKEIIATLDPKNQEETESDEAH